MEAHCCPHRQARALAGCSLGPAISQWLLLCTIPMCSCCKEVQVQASRLEPHSAYSCAVVARSL